MGILDHRLLQSSRCSRFLASFHFPPSSLHPCLIGKKFTGYAVVNCSYPFKKADDSWGI